MGKKIVAIAVIGAVVALAIGQAASFALNINGKAVAGKTMVSKGETYVPLSALKAAGVTATVKAGTLHLGLNGDGGANQVKALEGGVGDWLFNGIWRFKVVSVSPNDDGRPGWKVEVELRNGTKLDAIQLGGTGFESLMLVMADGNAIKPYNITDIDRPISQGATAGVALVFYDDEGNGRKPEKLILRIVPDEGTRNFLKNQGVAYTVGDPSFRINLKKE